MDGEACIGYHSSGKEKSKRFIIEIGMTEESIIDWLCANYGGWKQHKPSTKPHKKDMWRWRVQGKKAQSLYSQLEPILKIKKI